MLRGMLLHHGHLAKVQCSEVMARTREQVVFQIKQPVAQEENDG